MTTLDEWTAAVCVALGLAPDALERELVLDLARETAHGVARPAAPLTAYLAGLAVGRGADPDEVAATIRALLPPEGDAAATGRALPPPAGDAAAGAAESSDG
jgi:hypothetical protein